MAQSGIAPSPELCSEFAALSESENRAILASIVQESIHVSRTLKKIGNEIDDFSCLAEYLLPLEPLYVLYRLDNASFLAIVYVPDAAPVKQKMLYSSSKAGLLKQLGESNFSDTLFATDKSDLTPEAYKKHLAHRNADSPLTSAEKDKALINQAEKLEIRDTRQISGWSSASAGLGLPWSDEAQSAVQELAADTHSFVSLSIDIKTETVILLDTSSKLNVPSDSPSYSFYKHDDHVVFIYSCPSNSPIKSRLLFSSSVAGVIGQAKANGIVVGKKIETSDPAEITQDFIEIELGTSRNEQSTTDRVPAQTFSKPRRPGKR